jgi:hypothetical protein
MLQPGVICPAVCFYDAGGYTLTFDELDRIVADEFIDYIEIGMAAENSGREIHIHWKI